MGTSFSPSERISSPRHYSFFVLSTNHQLDLCGRHNFHSQTGVVQCASLDHDLGDYAPFGGDGYRVVDWMAENSVWPPEGVQVHSDNPVGRARIQGVTDRYGPY